MPTMTGRNDTACGGPLIVGLVTFPFPYNAAASAAVSTAVRQPRIYPVNRVDEMRVGQAVRLRRASDVLRRFGPDGSLGLASPSAREGPVRLNRLEERKASGSPDSPSNRTEMRGVERDARRKAL